jgi:hypothetical protein
MIGKELKHLRQLHLSGNYLKPLESLDDLKLILSNPPKVHS